MYSTKIRAKELYDSPKDKILHIKIKKRDGSDICTFKKKIVKCKSFCIEKKFYFTINKKINVLLFLVHTQNLPGKIALSVCWLSHTITSLL